MHAASSSSSSSSSSSLRGGGGRGGGLGGIIELHVKENFPDCKRNFFRNDVHLLPLLRNLIHILY